MNERKKAAIEKYHREKMENISIRARTADHLRDRIKAAAALRGIPPARYIRRAIDAALAMDGIEPMQAPADDPE